MISCLVSKGNGMNFVLKIYLKKHLKNPPVCGYTPKRTYASLSQKLLHIRKECQHATCKKSVSPYHRDTCTSMKEFMPAYHRHTSMCMMESGVSTPLRFLHTHICYITIHNSQDMKLSLISTNK